MGVVEYVQFMRSDPRNTGVEGIHYETAVFMERKLWEACQELQGDQRELIGVWRSWLALKISMLWDDITECPHGYRWEPATLTC